jgi:hypothetical protein
VIEPPGSLGHTERISFGKLWLREDPPLLQGHPAGPCKYLERNGDAARCAGKILPNSSPTVPVRQRQRLGGSRFRIVERRWCRGCNGPSPRQLTVLARTPAPRPLHTSDGGQGGCRDLRRNHGDKADPTRLLVVRLVTLSLQGDRERDDNLEADDLGLQVSWEDGIACELHGRKRQSKSAKPTLCHRWPHPTGAGYA